MANKPRIRFKGFTEDWEQRKLSDISTKVTRKNVNVHYTETLTNSAEQGIISQVDFFDKEISNKDNINGYYIVDNNDFIYNPRISTLAPVGPINRNKLNRTGIMSPLYTVFRSSNVDLGFLEWYFQSSHWHRYMKLKGDSGARADRIAIKDSTFFEMPIKIPVNIKEQVLIGETLEKFNQYITLHQCKLEKLKLTKKALLQKLFPKNGKHIPEIRFKGFTDAWEQRKLSDILKVNSGKDYKHLDQGNIPVYGTGGYMLSVNESLSNIDAIGIGRKGTIDKPQYLKAPFWTVDTLFYLTALDKHSILFLYYLMQLIPWKKFDESTGVPSLSKTTIDNISGFVPSNFQEEELISALFNQLDKSITLHQRKLERLQEVKKGLLQKMFV